MMRKALIPVLFGNVQPTAQALAVVAAMNPSPTPGRRNLIYILVNAWVASGVWTKFDAIWVMANYAQQPANLNWINPGTFTLTGVSGPTFTIDRGYNGDGVSSYVNTTFNPATNGVNFTRNSSSLLVWSGTTTAQAQGLIGNVNTVSDCVIVPRSTTSDSMRMRINDLTTLISVNNLDGSGMYTINRSGASARQMFRNTTQVTSDTTASIAVNSTVFTICGSSPTLFSTAVVRAAAIGSSLSLTDVSNFYNPLTSYLSAIGATP